MSDETRSGGLGAEPNCEYEFADAELRFIEPKKVTVLTAWPTLESYSRRPRGKKRTPFWPTFKVIRPFRRAQAEAVAAKPAEPEQLSFDFAVPIVPTFTPPPTAKAREDLKRQAFEDYRRAFPPEIADAVAPFQFEQWSVLRLLQVELGAIDMLAANPAMAFALACATFGRDGALYVKPPEVCLQKQRSIAEFLGYPGADWVVKLLRKVPPESVHSGRIKRLQSLCEDDASIKILQQLPTVNAGVIEILSDAELAGAVEPSLIAEVATNTADRYRPESAELLRDTLAMAYEELPKFRTLRAVHQAHDSLIQDEGARRRLATGDRRFPRPPVAGIPPKIVPIGSVAELVKEGQEQSNCVAGYAGRVLSRQTYIYKVFGAERATLSLVKGHLGRWEVGELKAAGNARVSSRTEGLVMDWLRLRKQC